MSTDADSASPTVLARLTEHKGPVHAVTFSAGTGQYLLTGCQDRLVRLFNAATSRLVQTYSLHAHEVLDLAVAQDNARFVSVGGDKTVFLWDVATAQTIRRFSGHAGRVNACAFGGDDDGVIASASFDGRVLLWDARSRADKPLATLADARDAVSAVRIRDACVFAGSVDGRVRAYDLRRGQLRVDVLGASVTSVAPDALGEAYLASTLDSRVRLMDAASGRCLQTFAMDDGKDGGAGRGGTNETYRLRSALIMGDALATSGTEDGRVLVWDVETGRLVHRLQHSSPSSSPPVSDDKNAKRKLVSAVAWNPLRRQLASAGGDGHVVVWKFAGSTGLCHSGPDSQVTN